MGRDEPSLLVGRRQKERLLLKMTPRLRMSEEGGSRVINGEADAVSPFTLELVFYDLSLLDKVIAAGSHPGK